MSLQIENAYLSFTDGDEQRVILDGVSLSVEPGEVVAFTGVFQPNSFTSRSDWPSPVSGSAL